MPRRLAFAILADTVNQNPLSHTQFGVLWRKAVSHNPFIQAMALNFGLIGVATMGTDMHMHSRRMQNEGSSEILAIKGELSLLQLCHAWAMPPSTCCNQSMLHCGWHAVSAVTGPLQEPCSASQSFMSMGRQRRCDPLLAMCPFTCNGIAGMH